MIAAGLGCRRGCGADELAALVRRAEALAGHTADTLAAPASKRDEAGLHGAARLLGLPLRFVDEAALLAAQPRCATFSATALRATGVASVAEGAALALAGGRLLLPRIAGPRATCALAGPDPRPEDPMVPPHAPPHVP